MSNVISSGYNNVTGRYESTMSDGTIRAQGPKCAVPAVTVTLTSYNMGDATESDFDAWASFVAARIDDATGLDVTVDQARFGEAGKDEIRGNVDDDMVETVREALRDLWDAFCADGAQ